MGNLLVGAAGWTDWNLVLHLEGGPNHIQNFVDSPFIANTTSGSVFYKNPMYYAMGHFSKFIPRDSIHIDIDVLKEDKHSPFIEPLKVISFVTPENRVVVVALNYDPTHVQHVQILDSNRGYLTLTLLPESIQTIIYNLSTWSFDFSCNTYCNNMGLTSLAGRPNSFLYRTVPIIDDISLIFLLIIVLVKYFQSVKDRGSVACS